MHPEFYTVDAVLAARRRRQPRVIGRHAVYGELAPQQEANDEDDGDRGQVDRERGSYSPPFTIAEHTARRPRRG